MYKRILLAYNGGRAYCIVRMRGNCLFAKAETHLLAVATPSTSMYVEGFEGIVSEQGTQQQKLMKNVLAAEGLAALTQRGYSVTGHFTVGEPVEQICRIATELKCDLIVVGHKHKHSRLGRWWRGSISSNLADYCAVQHPHRHDAPGRATRDCIRRLD